MPNPGLHCSLCLADPTQPQKAKDTVYSLTKLNMHLRSGAHSRRAQVSCAINLESTVEEARAGPSGSRTVADSSRAHDVGEAADREARRDDVDLHSHEQPQPTKERVKAKQPFEIKRLALHLKPRRTQPRCSRIGNLHMTVLSQ